MAIELDPLPRHLAFLSPLSDERAERLVRHISTGLTGTVLDIGCGWAELLMRVVAAAPSCRGIGIELDAGDIAHAREQAALRGLAERLTLICGDATAAAPEHADAVICLGATHVWNEPGAPIGPLDYGRALGAIRRIVSRGARVAYGDAIWSAQPTPAAIGALSGFADEHVTLSELAQIAVSAGFTALAVHEASQDEWDVFESGYSAPLGGWLAGHEPDHPDAGEVRAQARRRRDAYLGGYRGILGMGYLELLAV